MRFLLIGSMQETEGPLAEQLKRIAIDCPDLFNKLLLQSERTAANRTILDDEISEYYAVIEDDRNHKDI